MLNSEDELLDPSQIGNPSQKEKLENEKLELDVSLELSELSIEELEESDDSLDTLLSLDASLEELLSIEESLELEESTDENELLSLEQSPSQAKEDDESLEDEEDTAANDAGMKNVDAAIAARPRTDEVTKRSEG